jgi:16S rRNA processing protein RimM
VVTEDESEFGTLVDVMATGANDVYVIETIDKKEVLLPAIKQCVLDIDIEKQIMKVHIMKGLLD